MVKFYRNVFLGSKGFLYFGKKADPSIILTLDKVSELIFYWIQI